MNYFEELKAQYKATLSVNQELISLYYNIGKLINEHKTWGNKFIENLASDIRLSFPNAKGYSVLNLKYMSKLAATYTDEQFVQQAVAQIPWGHTVVLLGKCSEQYHSSHCVIPSKINDGFPPSSIAPNPSAMRRYTLFLHERIKNSPSHN